MKFYTLFFIISFVTQFNCTLKADDPSAYVAKKGDKIYWAITPLTADDAFRSINQTLLADGIAFLPHVERNEKGQIIRLFGNIIRFDKTKNPPTNDLLASKMVPQEELGLWLEVKNIHLGNTGITLTMPPLGFWYDPKTGFHSDMITEEFPEALRKTIETELPTAVADQLVEANRAKIRQFKASLEKSKPAAAFTLLDTENKPVSLSDYKGKVVYLDFWAHWCGVCMVEMERTKQIKDHFKGQADLVFLYVSVDKPEDKHKWLATIKNRSFIGKHVLVENGQKSAIVQAYGINEYPTAFIIDRNGNFFSSSPSAPHLNHGKQLTNELELALSTK